MPESERQFWDRIHGVVVHANKECVGYAKLDRIASASDGVTCRICKDFNGGSVTVTAGLILSEV